MGKLWKLNLKMKKLTWKLLPHDIHEFAEVVFSSNLMQFGEHDEFDARMKFHEGDRIGCFFFKRIDYYRRNDRFTATFFLQSAFFQIAFHTFNFCVH